MPPKVPGTIITFYSYKGGTGRTMALANVAWLLASNGKRVLAVDWDLEAPGLHRYFQPFLIDRDLTSSDGVIELVLEFCTEAMTKREGEQAKDWYLPYTDILRYAASLDWDFGNGTLDFVSAGRQSASYPVKVNTFDWQNFYERLGGGVFLDAVAQAMRDEYEYILIDSRTGVSDTSGICTLQMPDALVVCFTLNNQSIEGAARVIASAEQQRRAKPLPIFPVPMRVDQSEKDKLEVRREVMHNKLGLLPRFMTDSVRRAYWLEVECLYIPWYAYEEVLATFGDKPGTTRTSLLASTERLCHYLSGGKVREAVRVDETMRQEVLARYARQGEPLADSDLNTRAEGFFNSLTHEEQETVRRLFTRLIRVPSPEEGGPAKGVQVALRDLEPNAPQVISKAASAGVIKLQTDKDESTVALQDEELIVSWHRCRKWVASDREYLLWRQKLRADLAEWRKNQDPGALLSGAPLRTARKRSADRPDELNQEEKRYIERSNRFRKFIVTIRTLLLLTVGGALAYWLYEVRREQRFDRVEVLLAQGDSLVTRGAVFAAVDSYGEAVDLAPHYANAYLKRGSAYATLGNVAKALTDFERAITINPMYPSPYFARGTLALSVGDTARAFHDLTDALSRDSSNAQAYVLRGGLNEARGDLNQALADYTRAVHLEPENASARLARASLLAESDRLDSAIVDYIAVLETFTNPTDSVLAATRLRQLGIDPRPVAVINRVRVQYLDSLDQSVVEELVLSLESIGWRVTKPSLGTGATGGDLRFFHPEDSRRAQQLVSDLELAAAKRGVRISLNPILVRGMPTKRGQFEVLLPPLSGVKQELPGKRR